MDRPQRVVVSGPTSFIGSAVTKALLNNGCEVFGLVRKTSKARNMLPRHPRFHEISCDISETEIWTEAIQHADIFYHFAWSGPGVAGRADVNVQRQNLLNSLECIRASAKLGVGRFVFAGSQAEYGKVDGIVTEMTPCNPVLQYGKSKFLISQEAPGIAREMGMEYVHTRIFSVYGPYDHPYTLIPSCIRCFLSGQTIELSPCTQKWNFLHVRDTASALVHLGDCDLRGRESVVVNVAGTDTRILKDFVEEIHRLCGNKGFCAYGSRQIEEQPVDNWPDISLLQSLIDWEPKVSFTDGILELIEMNLKEMESEDECDC